MVRIKVNFSKSKIIVKMIIAFAKEAINKKKNLFCTSMDVEMRKRLMTCNVYDAFSCSDVLGEER